MHLEILASAHDTWLVEAHQGRVAVAEPEIAVALRRIEMSSRLRNHIMEIVAAVLDQIRIAKDNAGAECGSHDRQVFKNGDALGISQATVKTHPHHVFQKPAPGGRSISSSWSQALRIH